MLCSYRQTRNVAVLEVEDVVVCSVLCAMQIATDQVARALKVTQGALIQAVAPRGAAETAGLQPTRRQGLCAHIIVCSSSLACSALHLDESRWPEGWTEGTLCSCCIARKHSAGADQCPAAGCAHQVFPHPAGG